ncbi:MULTISPECIES: tRNA (adenosine(37)-N6)-threonylcarbamoyltransferase complex dimerization subunit type 1 TsaB [unclassified Polynucleobacter]|uniref:tRNA (adenosine(37)-N6)-threonylcarbamoyltransferase complex dimerization subunit type 1 TsaB n=1 Tax=unclassified Polynucleobacter TaxID=2640945 RepID=UPI0008D880AD|nr:MULTISPECIES: tRNA (adenosine(37)-N6)-threonylcarbamoyltransferase complex dimerization subunit type 1 TsaB [unclassified Polynucleobacter]OHC09609.1 MAG: tRNA (adenosine(37)-N6)-threonylcarbamoyltransferase complex dimerization subunit type 1 TsaB [Polynucleobacter sp. GWA2_45_21]HBK43249.1 tRNA (adenosine(37)-N6)-threonylcarbamoyltransferase complex dimerization subunit type 1 TsaB [Polynucleobacter sp.]
MTRILAIDTSSAWCSVALSLSDAVPLVRHQKVSAGASQLLLPWVDELLSEASIELTSLDAIAIGVGPGAFTGVRLGVAAVQGLAIATRLPVLPVSSLDAIASQLVLTPAFIASGAQSFVIAVDARMEEVYWARYRMTANDLPQRQGDIHLSAPEGVDLTDISFLAGSAIAEFGDRIFASISKPLSSSQLDSNIGVNALGVLACAQDMWSKGLQQDIHLLEPLYIRNKVALTSAERSQLHG